MQSRFLLLSLLAGFAMAPAVQAGDPYSPDTKTSARGVARDTGELVSDSTITTKVKASLLTEKNLKALGIDVDTDNGVVTLSGTVPSSAEVKQAEDLARHVKGVRDVNNALRVKNAG